MRFVGSELDNEGRVEFCQGGVWQVICPGGIAPTSATVVCRELGHDPIGGKDRSNVCHQLSKLLFSFRWLSASDIGSKFISIYGAF